MPVGAAEPFVVIRCRGFLAYDYIIVQSLIVEQSGKIVHPRTQAFYETRITMARIDLNTDVGESFGRWTLGDDRAYNPDGTLVSRSLPAAVTVAAFA
jgi:hypothetical protein